MDNLPLTMLRALAAVYEEGGVRAAGRRLLVTHSAISRHLHELEQWIGTPLVEKGRGRHSFRLTPEGETLARASADALQSLGSAVSAVREARRPNAVTISTTPSFAVRWLLPRLPDFEQRYRWIEVSVLVEQRRKAPLDEGADFSIRMGSGPWPDLQCEPLMDDALFPVANANYVARSKKDPGATDMSGLRLLHDRDPNAAWSSWKRQFGPSHMDVRSGPRYTSSDIVMRVAEQGMGVALARAQLCQESLEVGSLVRLAGDAFVPLPKAYWIVQAEGKSLRNAAQIFKDWMVEMASRSIVTR